MPEGAAPSGGPPMVFRKQAIAGIALTCPAHAVATPVPVHCELEIAGKPE